MYRMIVFKKAMFFQVEGAFVADGGDEEAPGEPAGSVHHRRVAQQALPVHVDRLPTEANVTQVSTS
jgi:hypothetical protein